LFKGVGGGGERRSLCDESVEKRSLKRKKGGSGELRISGGERGGDIFLNLGVDKPLNLECGLIMGESLPRRAWYLLL